MEIKMELVSIEEKIRLLKNLLEDPDDEISREILRLNSEVEKDCDAVERNPLVISPLNKAGPYKS